MKFDIFNLLYPSFGRHVTNYNYQRQTIDLYKSLLVFLVFSFSLSDQNYNYGFPGTCYPGGVLNLYQNFIAFKSYLRDIIAF